MQFKPSKHSGGGVVFIDITTKKPITIEWRKNYGSAKKYWEKHYNKDPNIAMKPVADVNFFLMSFGIGADVV